MSNELIITQSSTDSRNRDLATMAEAIRDLCICESVREPRVCASMGLWDENADRMAEIRDRFDPPTLTTSCPKCEVCDGLRHHWMANPQPDDSLPEYACEHCSVRGRACEECDGHGCLECGCEGVIEEPT